MYLNRFLKSYQRVTRCIYVRVCNKVAEKDESQALLLVHFNSSLSVFEGIIISNKCRIIVDCTYVS